MNTPEATDDPRVVSALQSSVLLAAAATVMRVVWRAAARSRTASLIAHAKRQWDAESIHARRLAIGVTLIVAAVTNLLLSGVSEQPAGWLWIAPPAMTASLGAVFVVLSKSRGASSLEA